MTHDGQDIDAAADAILRPHARAQAREADAQAQRRKVRSRFVGSAAGVIALLYAAYLLYEYVQRDGFTWYSVVIVGVMFTAAVAIWRRR